MSSSTSRDSDDITEPRNVDQQPQPKEEEDVLPSTTTEENTTAAGEEESVTTPPVDSTTAPIPMKLTPAGATVEESNGNATTTITSPVEKVPPGEVVAPHTEDDKGDAVVDTTAIIPDEDDTPVTDGETTTTSDNNRVVAPTSPMSDDEVVDAKDQHIDAVSVEGASASPAGDNGGVTPPPTQAADVVDAADSATPPHREDAEMPLSHEVVEEEKQHNVTLVNNEEGEDQTPRRPSPLPPRPVSSSRRRPGSSASSTNNNNNNLSPNINKQQTGRTSHTTHRGGKGGGSKVRARFVVEDPEKVCGMHVEQCDKRIELLQKRIADLEEMERRGASKISAMASLNHSKTIDPGASFASLSTMSPYGGQPRGWKAKAKISPDDEGRMLERLTRPKQAIEHEEIPIGNRFRSRQDEDNAPIDELDDEERAARIQEMVERLAGDDVSMRATNREERLEREAPNAPQEQWKGVVATLREGRRRFNRIMKGGADDEEEEEDFDEEDEDGNGPFRLSIEKQEALAQRLCNESLHKKQEGVKELTRKFYGDDVARRKDGVLGDHYQATGMCLPYEVGTIAAKTSQSPYRRYGGMPSLGPSSGGTTNTSSSSIAASKKLNTSSPFGEDTHTTPLRHNKSGTNNNNTSSSSPVAVGGKLPPLLSPVVARRLKREKKMGSPERKPTPAELGKRLHDDSRAHYRETQKELESKYLVNPLTRATQFADAGATGSSVVEKPLKYITPSEVKALGDRLCQPASRGPK